MKPVAVRCVLALLVVSTLATAPHAAATRVCPEGVPVAAPDTPIDAADSILESQVGEDGGVRVCYDPATEGCSHALWAEACLASWESSSGSGECEGASHAARHYRLTARASPHPALEQEHYHWMRSYCESPTGAGNFRAFGYGVGAYEVIWGHDGSRCSFWIVLGTPLFSVPLAPPCVPLVGPPPFLPALP